MTTTTELTALLEQATRGPWKQGATLTTTQTRRWSAAQMQANDAVEKQRVFANFDFGDEGRSRVFIAETRAEANARLIAMAPDLAARVIELEAENKRLREGLKAKPLPPTDAELREMLAKIVSVWWSESSYQKIMTRDLSPFDIKGMYAVRDVIAPYIARAALTSKGEG